MNPEEIARLIRCLMIEELLRSKLAAYREPAPEAGMQATPEAEEGGKAT